jgi:multiple sugar transport system permease protein
MSVPAARVETGVAVSGRAGRIGWERWLGPDYRLGFLFVAPIAASVLALVAYPFCYAIYLSLTHKLVGMPPIFVGLENYARLAEDGFFHRAVYNSFLFTFASVLFKLLLGVVMAVVLMTPVRWRSFWTGVLLIPWVAPTVVSALNFLWIYDGSLGVLNYLLVRVFKILPQGIGWLSEPGTAMASVIAVNVWRGFPFGAVILLAGMTAIPSDILDAAKVDGAGPVTRFRKVIVPLILPVLFVGTLYDLVFTLTDMTIVYLLTLGGPANSTHVLSSYAFLVGVQSGALGRGAAIAILLFPILLVVVFFVLRGLRRRDI